MECELGEHGCLSGSYMKQAWPTEVGLPPYLLGMCRHV
jgi:hypothetical protein